MKAVKVIAGPHTGISNPKSIGFDALGNLYILNFHYAGITIYPPAANGDATPARIVGAGFLLRDPEKIAVDSAGAMYVWGLNFGLALRVYPATANAATTPLGPFPGTNQFLGNSPPGAFHSIAIDHSGNVTGISPAWAAGIKPALPAIVSYGSSHAGTTIPAIAGIVQGPRTGLPIATQINYDYEPYVIAVGPTGEDFIGVGDLGRSRIEVFAPSATGDVAPIRTIEGPATTLGSITALAVDASGRLYVLNADVQGGSASLADPTLLVFAAGASGNTAPLAIIPGSTLGGFADSIAISP